MNIGAGTYTVASGTSYEAENGVVSGSATIPSDPSFSGGKAVGFLGRYWFEQETYFQLIGHR